MQTKNTETNVKQISIAHTFTLHNFIYSYGLSVTSYLHIAKSCPYLFCTHTHTHTHTPVSAALQWSWGGEQLVQVKISAILSTGVCVCTACTCVCLCVRAAYAQANLSLHWSLMGTKRWRNKGWRNRWEERLLGHQPICQTDRSQRWENEQGWGEVKHQGTRSKWNWARSKVTEKQANIPC